MTLEGKDANKQNRRNAGGSGATITPEQAFRLEDVDPQDQRRLLVSFLREHGMTLKEGRAVLADVPFPARRWDLAAATATKDLQRAGFDKWISTQVDPKRFHETLLL